MENDVLKQFIEWVLNEKGNISLCDSIEYEKGDRWVKIGIEVMGTQFNDRSALIENIKEGDPLKILRDPDNFFDRFTLSVCNQDGQELGTMWMNLADVLSPVLDEGLAQIIESHATEVVPLSKREEGAAKPILKMEMTVFLTQEVELTREEPETKESMPKEPVTAQSIRTGTTVPLTEKEQTGGEVIQNLSTLPAEPFTDKTPEPVTATAQTVADRTAPLPTMPGREAQPKSSKAWLGTLIAGILIWVAVLGGAYYYATTTYIPSQHYKKGYELYRQEKYTLAADELHRAGTYNGADQLLADCYKKMVSGQTEDEEVKKEDGKQ